MTEEVFVGLIVTEIKDALDSGLHFGEIELA